MALSGSYFGQRRANAERGAWVWFVGIGAALTLLGCIASADLFLSTIATAYFIGALMFAGGVLQLVHAFAVRHWRRAALWALCGVLYLAAAGAVLDDPLFAAALITALFAVSLAASGLMRAVFALGWRGQGWRWMLLSGIVSIAAAAVIAIGWPIDAIWLLGLLLSLDLLFQGIMMMLLGLALRSTYR
ncbi:HdeD family acid-resistance protein [soil metagenome]